MHCRALIAKTCSALKKMKKPRLRRGGAFATGKPRLMMPEHHG